MLNENQLRSHEFIRNLYNRTFYEVVRPRYESIISHGLSTPRLQIMPIDPHSTAIRQIYVKPREKLITKFNKKDLSETRIQLKIP